MIKIFAIKKQGKSEITEKKSKFIAKAIPITSKEEAEKILESIRKEYWDASHNVYAYKLEGNISKYSDDGEPQGTSGLPVFSIIEAKKIENILIVVTRYFGGTLLGKGGLVRAYTKAATLAITDAELEEIKKMSKIVTICDYSVKDKILSLLSKSGLESQIEFTDTVKIEVILSEKEAEKTKEDIIKITKDKISTKILSE